GRRVGQRRARYPDELVDGHALRVRRQRGERVEERHAVLAGLAHAEDAAAAYLQARVANVLQGPEAIGVGTGRDDLRVESLGGIEIVVVEIQPGLVQRLRLFGGQHAE